MRKSKHGKETMFLWEGYIKPGDIVLIPTDAKFVVEDSLQRKIRESWKEVISTNPPCI